MIMSSSSKLHTQVPSVPDGIPDGAVHQTTSSSLSHFRYFAINTSFSMKRSLALIPLVFILIAASTRFVTHPAALDLLTSSSSHDWESAASALSDWSLHKRHPDLSAAPPQSASTQSSVDSPSSSVSTIGTAILSASPTSTPVPPIPVDPLLPNPFPTPFASLSSSSFSTESCYNFFLNMSYSEAFVSCRPFSLLSTTSTTFITAQTNITELNDLIWGTCNTNDTQAECDVTMAELSSSLQSSCSIDLQSPNSTAAVTLNGLNSYDLMRTSACEGDETTGAYCYVEADASANPDSLYFYQLYLIGHALPSLANNTSICTPCIKDLMDMYYTALGQNGSSLTGLQQNYAAAALQANQICGADFAQSTTSTSHAASSRSLVGGARLLTAFILLSSIATSVIL